MPEAPTRRTKLSIQDQTAHIWEQGVDTKMPVIYVTFQDLGPIVRQSVCQNSDSCNFLDTGMLYSSNES